MPLNTSRTAQHSAGGVLVEAAVALTLLVVLLTGFANISFILIDQEALTEAARVGARIGANDSVDPVAAALDGVYQYLSARRIVNSPAEMEQRLVINIRLRPITVPNGVERQVLQVFLSPALRNSSGATVKLLSRCIAAAYLVESEAASSSEDYVTHDPTCFPS